MRHSRKVLILAYDFPPYNSIAAQRPASWLRYFRQFNAEPTVVTRHWDIEIKNHTDCFRSSRNRNIQTEQTATGVIIRAPYNENFRDKLLARFGEHRFVLIRKVISFLLEILKYHFLFFDNRSGIYKAAKEELSQHRYDVILATGEPFILFRYAQLLSKESGIPWVADYRDGWSINRIHPPKTFPEKILAWHARYMESKLVPQAHLITTASPSYKNDLQGIFPDKQIEVIYNGFDDDTVAALPELQQDKEIFTIAYAGTIYGYQRLEIFLEGFQRFLEKTQAENVKMIFYGVKFYPEQVQRIRAFYAALLPYIELTDKLPYRETLLRLKQASLLLLLGAKGNLTLSAKIFDYLAVRRRILYVQSDQGVLQGILQETNGGICCDGAHDVCEGLIKSYAEHRLHGEVVQQTRGFENYSRKNQAGKMVCLLQSITLP